MDIVIVKKLEKKHYTNKGGKAKRILEKFLQSNVKRAIVDTSTISKEETYGLYRLIYAYIYNTQTAYPVKVNIKKGLIFLKRTDL